MVLDRMVYVVNVVCGNAWGYQRKVCVKIVDMLFVSVFDIASEILDLTSQSDYVTPNSKILSR
jgi:hypothetical protein